MAWRPNELLIEGELTNCVPGQVTGYILFRGLDAPVIVNLDGDFHRDIRGTTIKLKGQASFGGKDDDARQAMEGFALNQAGEVGDITAGLNPVDYVDYPYIEWYSKANGRIVLELEPEQVTVIGTPLPAATEQPNDIQVSRERFQSYMRGLVESFGEKTK
jgi:hypothetical protein